MQSARDKALEYLGRFARTERQLADYLRRKEYPDDEIKQVLAWLRERGFVNDRAFADSFIQARIQHLDGPRKIKQMLFQKGVPSSITDELLQSAYPFELQLENVKALAAKKQKAGREKLLRFIASRGFSQYVIIQAFNDLNRS